MKKTKTTDATPVLKMAEVTAMKQTERIASFKAKDMAQSRLFIELAKLLIGIRAELKDPSQATPLLKKQGIRPGSVNSASEAARVYQELVPKHLPEEAFDTLLKSDIASINRCMSGASKRKLKSAEVAELIASSPDTFQEELDSIFETGHDLAEAAAQAEREEKEAEAARIAAEQKKKDAEAAQQPQTPPQPETKPTAQETAPKAAKETGEPTASKPPTPQAEDQPEPDAPTAEVKQEATNIIPGPVAKSTVSEVLETCDLIEVALGDLTDDEAEQVFHRLAEINSKLADRLQKQAA